MVSRRLSRSKVLHENSVMPSCHHVLGLTCNQLTQLFINPVQLPACLPAVRPVIV